MLSRFPTLLAVAACCGLSAGSIHASSALQDRVIFKNGREMDGVIVKGDADSITLRHGGRDETFRSALIRRIDDTEATGAYFAAASQSLPPWKALVNDLRTYEDVHDLRQIARGRETTGPFAGVAYVAFQMNDAVDLRVYGDPKNPAGLELGLRGAKAGDRAERLRLRSFLAGFLTERSQISALYSLREDGGEKSAGDLHIAFGTAALDSGRPQWWMAAWNPASIQHFRGRAETADVSAISGGWDGGFQRDKDGTLRPLTPQETVALGY